MSTPKTSRKKATPKVTKPELPTDMKLPAAKWTDNDRSLIGLLLTALEEDKYVKRAIWPAPEDKSTSIKKAVAYRDVADTVFSELPPFAEYFKYKNALSYYGKAVGAQITVLEKAYHKAKDIMGVTGGGLDSEEEITAGTPMMDKWKAAQEVCPEFYRLKIMLGERMNVSTHTINNSGQSIDLTSVLPGSSRRAARSASDNEVTTHSDAAAEEEDEDAEGDDDNDDIVETTEDGVPTIAVTEASPRKNKGKEKVSRSSSPSTRSQSISPSRKRGPSEFEHLLDIVEQGESRKRRRDIGIEQTKRLESQEETRRQAGKDSLELQRLKLEMAERQAVREHEMTMAKLRIYGVEAVAMPLESSMKKMNINVNAMESPGTLNAAGDAIGPVNGALEDISSIDYQEWMEQEDKVI